MATTGTAPPTAPGLMNNQLQVNSAVTGSAASLRNDEIIRIERIGHSFKIANPRNDAKSEVVALEGIDLTVRRGEFFALIGPSGCGKSTLLSIIAGLTRPSSGKIYVNDKLVVKPGLDRGVVFQEYALFPWRTAQANVEFGLESQGLSKSERTRVACEYLSLVGLLDFAHSYPHQLSGGMKQRVAIARSLAPDPEVLLMDEPFGALDTQTREILQEQLLHITQETGKTIVFVTHSIEEAVLLADRVAVITARPGRIKALVDIPLTKAERLSEDIRSSSAFIQLRRELSTLLSDEVIKSNGDVFPSRDILKGGQL